MQIFSSCTKAIQSCKETRSFAVAHLYNDDIPMKMHIHDTYEIYYSISGGRQFLIDNRFYDFHPGDIFFINQFESHYLSQLDKATHERIVISIDPAYLISLSTEKTDLNHCFSAHDQICGHRISLTDKEQKRFMYFIHRFQENEEMLRLGETVVSFDSGTVENKGEVQSLTAKEYAILHILAENRGKIVTMDALCDALWPDGSYGLENSLIVHIRHLREKIEADPSNPKHLVTARGLGYKLEK